jgi:hypothetical protein
VRKNGVGVASANRVRISVADIVIIITVAVFVAMLIHFTFAKDDGTDGYNTVRCQGYRRTR